MFDTHLDWSPEAIQAGKAPNCGPGKRTLELHEVDCQACNLRVIELLTEWVNEAKVPTLLSPGPAVDRGSDTSTQ